MARWLKHVPPIEATAATISICAGVLMLGIKFGAYFLTGSTAIFADALEGLVNVTTSMFAAYALTLAHRPADQDHPYGHGKIEFFSAGFEGGLILLAAGVAIAKAGEVLFRQQFLRMDRLGLGLVLMLIALVVNAVVGGYLIRTGKKHSSITLEADGHHLISDAVTSAAALATLLLVRATGWSMADPIGAIIVSLYIASIGIRLLRRSASGLMDEQDVQDTAKLRHILDSHLGPEGAEPRICSYHKLRHRHSGRYHWVDFHMMVPGWWNIEQGHRAASTIEYEIEQALNEGNATAHVEPCHETDCPTCAVIQPGAMARE
jgi:cation diffusion facilitator family transporter